MLAEPGPSKKMFTINYQVSQAEVDPVYNHVDHSRIFKIFERARLALLEAVGFPSDKLIAEGIFPVITRIEASYRREVLLEELIVSCDSIQLTEKTLVIPQSIFNARGKLAVAAVAESMFVCGESKRAIRIPDDCLAALREFSIRSNPPD